MQGHADYTPVVLEPRELVGMSRARELAQGVIFSAPFLCFGDYPKNYQESPAANLIRALPATYDETRVLSGSEIGECVALAKRRGEEWWIAVENGGRERTLTVPLDFLGAGEWKLSGFASVKGDLQALRAVDSSVPSASTLTLRIEPCGGFVARCVR